MSPDAPDYTLLSDVNVVGSVTLDVNVVGSVTINANITGVESGVTFDVNIAHSDITLDVVITNATVTLNVNITNEFLQSSMVRPVLAFVRDMASRVDMGADYPFPTQDFTLAFRIKWQASATKVLFNKDNPWWNYGFLIRVNSDGTVTIVIGDGSTHEVLTTVNAIQRGEWITLGFVFYLSNGQIIIYQNGSQLETLNPTLTSIAYDNSSTTIGYTTDLSFSGFISHFAVMTTVSGAWWHQQFHQNPDQPPPTNPLETYYNFMEGEGTLIKDRGVGGHDATAVNCMWMSSQGSAPALVNVNLIASQITMDVNVTNSVLNIQGNVEITNAELNIRITAQDINVEVINPTNWRVAFGSPTLLPETFSDTVSGGTLEYSVWSKSITEGVRHVMRITLILYNPSTYWSPYDVVIHVIADGSDVINYRISDSHYYLGAGFLEAWLSGKSPDLYVLDPQDPAPVKVLWIKTGTTAPTFDGSPWTATTAPDIYAIGILIDIPFDFTDSAEIRVSNTPSGNPDIYVRGAVFYGIYK